MEFRLVRFSFFVLLISTFSFAQASYNITHGPDGKATVSGSLQFQPACRTELVKHKPFSAEEVHERPTFRSDSPGTVETSVVKIYRNSDGFSRVDHPEPQRTENGPVAYVYAYTEIFDKQFRYVIDPNTGTIYRSKLRQPDGTCTGSMVDRVDPTKPPKPLKPR